MAFHEVLAMRSLLHHPYVLLLSGTPLRPRLVLLPHLFPHVVILNQLLLQVLPLGQHDLMLLLHPEVLLHEDLLLLPLQALLQLTLPLSVLDLLHQLSLVCICVLPPSHVFAKQMVLMAEVILGLLFGEQLIKLLVLHLLVSRLIRQVLGVFAVNVCDSLLPGDTFGHLLHMVVVVLHEGRHCEIQVFNSCVLVFILVDLVSLLLIEVHLIFLVKLELWILVTLLLEWQVVALIDEWF